MSGLEHRTTHRPTMASRFPVRNAHTRDWRSAVCALHGKTSPGSDSSGGGLFHFCASAPVRAPRDRQIAARHQWRRVEPQFVKPVTRRLWRALSLQCSAQSGVRKAGDVGFWSGHAIVVRRPLPCVVPPGSLPLSRQRFAKAARDPRTGLKFIISGPFLFGSLVGVGPFDRTRTCSGTLEPVPLCAHRAH